MKRPYQLKQRARAQDKTRQRIVEAAIELHQSKGLAATSFADIAKRANVGKVTVYRHFPDELALVGACSGQYFDHNPLPEIESWWQTGDAGERLRYGLLQVYRFHRQTEPMLGRVLAEARDLAIMEPYHAHWNRAADILAEPFMPSDEDRPILQAALALALAFETWQLLVNKNRLSDDQAVELVTRLICK
jgi:AcrR family transcriptional regulator